MMTAERGRRRFRPRPWPTLIAAPAFVVLLGLGNWQLERLAWKEEIIATRAARMAAPALDHRAVRVPTDELELRRVRLEGAWLHEHEVLLESQIHRGAAGYHVVTPLRLEDGRLAIIDRGFVPAERRAPASRLAGQIAGPVAIEGVLRKGGRPGPWTPDNDPQRNVWYFIDPPAMVARLPAAPLFPFVVEAGAAPNPGGLPIGGQTMTEIRNDHLGYAITWFGLAAALAAIYILYHLRRDPAA